MSSNIAAWITGPKSRLLQIGPAPMGVPEENQILVRNRAVAINPIDGKIQSLAMIPLENPTILGQDVAGEIAAVGPNVTRFTKGQRVTGNTSFPSKRSEDKGFQAYTILDTNMTSEIPISMSWENAVVIPTGLSTAAAGLFQPDYLNLQLPTEPRRDPTGTVLLVWSGASSVGCNAVQLAVAAGYEVFATASPANFNLVRKLGASLVLDYRSPTVVEELIAATRDKGKRTAGALVAIGSGVSACAQYLQRCDGARVIATAVAADDVVPNDVTVVKIYTPSIANNHVGAAIWEHFLPRALEAGTYIPAPQPLVVGKGLESIQDAIDLQSQGVSAKKVVVLLD